MVQRVSTVQTAVERRRGEVERQLSIQDGVAQLSYSLTFQGAGESIIEVNLPCWFSEIPAVTSGFTMDSNSVLEDLNFPWASAGMILNSQDVGGRFYYTTGRIIVVMGGTRTQRMTVHCVAVGKAITAPSA